MSIKTVAKRAYLGIPILWSFSIVAQAVVIGNIPTSCESSGVVGQMFGSGYPTVQEIPCIMEQKLKWPLAAKLMRYWFAGSGENYMIRLEEVMSRSKVVKDAVEKLSNPDLFKGTGNQYELVKELQKTDILLKGGEFDYIRREITDGGKYWKEADSKGKNKDDEINSMHWTVSEKIPENEYTLDEFTGAFGSSDIRLVAKGNVVVEGSKSKITVTEVGIYFRDSYDFHDDPFDASNIKTWVSQPLGFWSKNYPYVSHTPIRQTLIGGIEYDPNFATISNSSFLKLDPREENSFRVLSDPWSYTIKYSSPITFTTPLQASTPNLVCPTAVNENTSNAGDCYFYVTLMDYNTPQHAYYKDVKSLSSWGSSNGNVLSVSGGKLSTRDISNNTNVAISATYGSVKASTTITVRETLPSPLITSIKVSGQTATFQWDKIPHATTYRILVSQYSDFRGFNEKDSNGQTSCLSTCYTYKLESLNGAELKPIFSHTFTPNSATTYYVKIRAGSAVATASNWSKIETFKVVPKK